MADTTLTPSEMLRQMDAAEVPTLAQELATAYRRLVALYREQLEMSTEEATARAVMLHSDAQAAYEDMLKVPPDQVMWMDLQALQAHDAELGYAVWSHLKQQARDEFVSGQRGAEPLVWDDRPWDRARFFALVQSFAAEWQPQGGIEMALIHQLAQLHTVYLFWLGELHIRSNLEVQLEDPKLRARGFYQPPRLDRSAAIEQAAAMADRFNRLFLRTLRGLRDYRRYAVPPVVVQNAEQVNVGQQQVNLSVTPPPDEGAARRSGAAGGDLKSSQAPGGPAAAEGS